MKIRKIKKQIYFALFSLIFCISSFTTPAQANQNGAIRTPQEIREIASPTPSNAGSLIRGVNPTTNPEILDTSSPTEAITDFESTIIVNKDSSLDVTENIKIIANNEQIQYGIYRDFPTKYEWKYGLSRNTGFEVLGIEKNGVKEPYSISKLVNGVRVYIGDKTKYIDPGIYTYTIHYKTIKQLGDFTSTDQLYYNITGNGWSFPIGYATATITFPGKFRNDEVKIFGFTGEQDSTAQNYIKSIQSSSSNSVVKVSTTGPLGAYQGLTVSIDWPKGSVVYPVNYNGFLRVLEDNYIAFIFLFVTVFLLFYYLFTWWMHGRDPKRSPIVPVFYPPENFSPAASRYIYCGNYDNKTIVAAIVNLGVKGIISIEEKVSKILFFEQKSYVLTLIKNEVNEENNDENLLVNSLFSGQGDSVTIDKQYNATFASANAKFSSYFDKTFRKKNFVNNAIYSVIGVIISILPVVIAIIQKNITIVIIVLIIIQLIFHLFFAFLLKARTDVGSLLKDKLEGFKMYLSTAEEDDLKLMNQEIPDTFEIYQKYLPYAIAFDVETNWTGRFEKVIASAQMDNSYNSSYLYLGGLSSFVNSGAANDFTNNLTSFVSSASTAPGSSGGSGGSSGGGGGGGGGGGW